MPFEHSLHPFGEAGRDRIRRRCKVRVPLAPSTRLGSDSSARVPNKGSLLSNQDGDAPRPRSRGSCRDCRVIDCLECGDVNAASATRDQKMCRVEGQQDGFEGRGIRIQTSAPAMYAEWANIAEYQWRVGDLRHKPRAFPEVLGGRRLRSWRRVSGVQH